MLLRKPKEVSVGKGSPALPVSTVNLGPPDSPTRVSSFGSVSSSSASTPSVGSEGHLVAGRNAFEEVALTDGKDFEGRHEQPGGLLNRKLSSLLERRKAKEAEALKSLSSEHDAELAQREDMHRDELNMKDSAHRRIVDHMEGELNDLREQLETALGRWEAAEASLDCLARELEVERKLRKAAEAEQRSLHSLLEAELEGM